MQNIQLSIPTPCHENWNSMTPSQQGRFCNACAKQVVDFSSMSDKEVLNYFSSVKDNEVCGRAFPQQLERSIEITPDKPKPFYHRYLNYAAMLLLLLKAGSVKAQGKIAVKPTPIRPVKHKLAEKKSPFIKTVPVPEITMGLMISQPARPVNKAESPIYTGYVTDENGLPLPAASIIVKTSGEAISADSTGKFVLRNFNEGSIITVSSVGYNDTSVVIREPGQTIRLTKIETLLNEVVVKSIGYNQVSTTTMGAMVSLRTCYKLKDSLKNRIISFNLLTPFNPSVTIYPNPVVKGNLLHVSVNFKKEGQYSLQICDAAGRQVFQQSIQATAKNYLKEMVAERSWGSGMFIIRIADDKNNVVKTDRFIAL